MQLRWPFFESKMRYAVIICAGVSFYCGFYYDSNVNAGHDSISNYYVGLAAMLGGTIWALLTYPMMGKSLTRDLLLIGLAFPTVGAIGGTFAFPGWGTFVGPLAAIGLPLQFPLPIAVVYVASAIVAFWLPRISRNTEKTST